MSDEPAPDLSALGMDLAKSFQPRWAQGQPAETKPQTTATQWAEKTDRPNETRRSRENFRRGSAPGTKGRRPPHPDRSPATQQEPVVLEGWKIGFVPREIGMDGLARQLRASGKVYSLFDLSRLVLEDPRRYELVLVPDGGTSRLFRVRADGSIWSKRHDAVRHALTTQLSTLYTEETETTDPPKGNFPCVAEIDGHLIGPPNYHEFQDQLRALHKEKFSHLPFERFRERLTMIRDPEAVEKWKASCSQRTVYVDRSAEESAPRLTRQQLERHFLETHATGALEELAIPTTLGGAEGYDAACPQVRAAVRSAHAALVRFPLPLAQKISKALSDRGLQIFKSHKKLLCVSFVRPKPFDGDRNALSDGLKQIFDYLTDHSDAPRQKQWKDLLNLRPPGTSRETAVASDLSWLIREGHVLDFANGSLQLARRQPPGQRPRPSGSAHESSQAKDVGNA